jgi:hypothetical protein
VEGASEKSPELELSDPELGRADDEPVDPLDVAA